MSFCILSSIFFEINNYLCKFVNWILTTHWLSEQLHHVPIQEYIEQMMSKKLRAAKPCYLHLVQRESACFIKVNDGGKAHGLTGIAWSAIILIKLFLE
jgi:hypothetical protein